MGLEQLQVSIHLARRYAFWLGICGFALYCSLMYGVYSGVLTPLEVMPFLLIGEAALVAAITLIILASIAVRVSRTMKQTE